MICPNPSCKRESKNLSDGRCRHCGIPLVKHKGVWYTENPIHKIIATFEQAVATQTRIPFAIPRTDNALYGAECKAAEHLLAIAGGNLEDTVTCVLGLFSDKGMGWKQRTTLRHVKTDFNLLYCKLLGERAKAAKAKASNQETVTLVVEKEDVFA